MEPKQASMGFSTRMRVWGMSPCRVTAGASREWERERARDSTWPTSHPPCWEWWVPIRSSATMIEERARHRERTPVCSCLSYLLSSVSSRFNRPGLRPGSNIQGNTDLETCREEKHIEDARTADVVNARMITSRLGRAQLAITPRGSAECRWRVSRDRL